ncbi:MAG: SDR family oxidoreductase [Verrucomicrobiota bacterium JB023]|nr:SDR family oxidoreductase [Verrucomicrobiota bacterium JB023]
MSLTYECGLITGASAGLGEEFARQLALFLQKVVLVARRRDRLEKLATELEASGIDVRVIAADLSSSEERERLAREVEQAGWTVDLLVNNAGLGDYGDFAGSEWARNQAMLQVNIEALTHLTHLFLPGMVAAQRGGIINVSSLASKLPIPDFAVYAATKAYVSSFSEALRLEVRELGIEVVAVCPGPVKTEFGSVAIRQENDSREPGGRAAFYVEKAKVVSDALRSLARGRPRIYPGLQVTLVAAGISLLPMALLRLIMGSRPRRQKLLE